MVTVNVKNPWADLVSEVDYTSQMVKESQSVLHPRNRGRSAWANWRPTPRDQRVTQWVQRAHGSYVKQETGASGSGVAPATEDPWARYTPSRFSRPPAASMFRVKREVTTEADSVSGVAPASADPVPSDSASGVTPASVSLFTRVKAEPQLPEIQEDTTMGE